MLLPPTSVHHFEDIGYRHDFLYQCPANAPGAQLPESDVLGRASSYPDSNVPWFPPLDGGSGCRCECDGRRTRNHAGYCLDKLKQPTRRERHWFTWLL